VNIPIELVGLLLIFIVLWDAFETILLPRRNSARLRISRFVLRALWIVWTAIASRAASRKTREAILASYAILSLLALLGVWAMGLIFSFALLQAGGGGHIATPGEPVRFATLLYMSGSNFLTLGLGDMRPVSALARTLTVIEAGTGFGFLALVLSYLPVLYQAFSRREARITMLDEWSGSPPSAAVALRRNAESETGDAIVGLLKDWETASAELLESHLSYPILAFFRSQHDNQSWLASLTTVLDVCALVITGVEGVPPFQARLTFAIARHAIVDLSQVFRRRPGDEFVNRLPPEELAKLRTWFTAAGVKLATGPEADRKLAELRDLYEPYVASLSAHLMMPLSGWVAPERTRFNWQTTAWARTGDDGVH
jgi:Ion channel